MKRGPREVFVVVVVVVVVYSRNREKGRGTHTRENDNDDVDDVEETLAAKTRVQQNEARRRERVQWIGGNEKRIYIYKERIRTMVNAFGLFGTRSSSFVSAKIYAHCLTTGTVSECNSFILSLFFYLHTSFYSN